MCLAQLCFPIAEAGRRVSFLDCYCCCCCVAKLFLRRCNTRRRLTSDIESTTDSSTDIPKVQLDELVSFIVGCLPEYGRGVLAGAEMTRTQALQQVREFFQAAGGGAGFCFFSAAGLVSVFFAAWLV